MSTASPRGPVGGHPAPQAGRVWGAGAWSRLLTRPLLPDRPRPRWPRWRWQTRSETAPPPWGLAARRSCGAAAGPARPPRARRPRPPSSSGTSSGPGRGSWPPGPRLPWGTAASLWSPVAGGLCRPPLLASQGAQVTAGSREASRSSVGYSQVQTQSVPLPSCTALGRSHSLSVPQFAQLSGGASFSISVGARSSVQGRTGEGSAGVSRASAGWGAGGADGGLRHFPVVGAPERGQGPRRHLQAAEEFGVN